VPFFPAVYHDSHASVFALATEAADLVVTAFVNATSLAGGRKSLISSIEENSHRIENVTSRLREEYKIKFRGIDFSLAPFPEQTLSLGTAFEKLGVPKVGLHGSLVAAAILTESIERAQFPRTGFNGLKMLVQGKHAGDPTSFEFGFFCNSR
jgi:uncharacterized protein (UPF0210 family)